MKVRNKEHQSLGPKEIEQLVKDFPNDQMLGEEIRKIWKDLCQTNTKQSS